MKPATNLFDSEENNRCAKEFQAKMAWGAILRQAAESIVFQKMIQKTFTPDERRELFSEIEDYLNGPMTESMIMQMRVGLEAVGKPEKFPESRALFDETKRIELLKMERVCCEDSAAKL